jgi:hypothetical protein
MSPKGNRKAAMPNLDTVAEEWALRRPMTGSGSGCFNLKLLNQTWNALWVMGTRDEWHREIGQRAATGALKDIAPRDPLEGMLAAQMIVVHDAALECFRRAHLPEQTFEGRQAALGQANKLVRSYTTLLEALDRHRGKGQPQVVRVERVTVEASGQAIVGSVAHPGPGGGRHDESEDRPHAQAQAAATLAHAAEPALRGADAGRQPVPVAGGGREAALPDARRRPGQRRA